jgi:hypothetical protein
METYDYSSQSTSYFSQKISFHYFEDYLMTKLKSNEYTTHNY